MIKKLSLFIEKINDKKNNERIDFSYTQTLRNARKEKCMTLEDVSYGISSVSYLSKLERNLLPIDVYYLKAFFEKLDIKYQEEETITIDDLKKIVRYRLNGLDNQILEKCNSFDTNLFSAIKSLMLCFALLIKKDYQSFNVEIKKLDNVKDSLPKYESITLVYLVIKYYEQTKQYKEASKYVILIMKLNIDDLALKNIVYDVVIKTAYNLHKYSLFYYIYNYIDYKNNLYYPTTSFHQNRLMQIDLLLQNKDIIIDNYEDDLYKNNNYYYLLNYYRKERYEEVLTKAINIKEWDENILCLFGYCVYITKNEIMKEIFDSKEKEANYEFSEETKMFIDYLHLIITDDKSYKVFEFLRKEAIPYSDRYQHFLYTKIYENNYIEFLANLSRYKDIWLYIYNKK